MWGEQINTSSLSSKKIHPRCPVTITGKDYRREGGWTGKKESRLLFFLRGKVKWGPGVLFVFKQDWARNTRKKIPETKGQRITRV